MSTFSHVFFGGIFLIGGFFVFMSTWRKYHNTKLLDEGDTRQTKAKITRAGWEKMGRTRVYRTYYSYTVDGTTFDKETDGNFSPYISEGMLPIRYLASDPSVHDVEGSTKRLDLEILSGVIFGTLFIIGAIFFGIFYQ